MTARDTIQVTITWPQILGGTFAGVTVLASIMWWMAGVRAEALDAMHHKGVPSETRAYISENYVSKAEFESAIREIRESQLRIEGALFKIDVDGFKK